METDKRREMRKHHLAKTISYRICSTIIMGGFTWALTGSPSAGISVALMDAVVMSAFYYAHERAWYHLGTREKQNKAKTKATLAVSKVADV